MKSCPVCKGIFPTDFTVCPKDGTTLQRVTEFGEGAVVRGKYQILSKLGAGGMGTVYKAKHLHFSEICALKVVKSHLLEEAEFLQRFRAEAQVMRRLDHPNAVHVRDLDETEDGRPFIVMEYVEGKSLDEELVRNGPLEPLRAVRVATQVCSALEAAHDLGIIHRDIKPSNILLIPGPNGADAAGGGSELVKVLDFGVAKVKEASTVLAGAGASLTRTGFVVGTPDYMSPEQAMGTRGEELDGRTDLYSLGVVLYESLTGRLPFSAETPVKMLIAHVQSRPRDPRLVRADLPAGLVELVLRSLEKEPKARYPSAGEMRAELETIERQLAPTAAVPTRARTAASPAPLRGLGVQPAPSVSRPSPPRAKAAPPPAAAPAAQPAARPMREIAFPIQQPSGRHWLPIAIGGLAVALVIVAVLFTRGRPAPTQPAAQATPTQTEAAAPTSTAPPTTTQPPPSSATGTAAPPTQAPAVEASKPRETPENARVRELLQSAREAMRRGDAESAGRYLQEAYKLDPRNPAVLEAVRRAKRAVAAETAAAEKRRAQEADNLMQRGRQAMDQGSYQEAIRAFEAVLVLDPNNAQAQLGLHRARRALAAEEEILRRRQR